MAETTGGLGRGATSRSATGTPRYERGPTECHRVGPEPGMRSQDAVIAVAMDRRGWNDIVEAFSRVLTWTARGPSETEILNVASGHEVSLLQLVDLISESRCQRAAISRTKATTSSVSQAASPCRRRTIRPSRSTSQLVGSPRSPKAGGIRSTSR